MGADLFRDVVPWCSGLTRLPVKEEIVSSNLIGIAILVIIKAPDIYLGLFVCKDARDLEIRSKIAFLAVRILG